MSRVYSDESISNEEFLRKYEKSYMDFSVGDTVEVTNENNTLYYRMRFKIIDVRSLFVIVQTYDSDGCLVTTTLLKREIKKV